MRLLDSEIEQLPGLFPGWQLELIQLGARDDTSSVSCLPFGSHRIIRLCAASAVAIRGSVPKHGSCVLVPASPQGDVRFFGQRLAANAVVQADAGAHIELFMSGRGVVLILVIESRRAGRSPDVAFDTGSSTTTVASGSRVAAVAVACRMVATRFPAPVKLTELCRACGVAQRTLEYGFRQVYETTPLAYMRSQRLTRNRMALLAANADTSIGDTARACGFTHMGQYCKDYRRLFGETPSMTVARGRLMRERAVVEATVACPSFVAGHAKFR